MFDLRVSAVAALALGLALPALAQSPAALTLEQAQQLVLTRSPALESFSWEVRARDAHVEQARSLPNPALEAEVEDFAGSGPRSGFDDSQTTVGVAQLVELGGKRDKRTQLAVRQRDLAEWDYQVARLALLAETRRRFVAVLALQERIALADELLGVARQQQDAVELSVRGGRTSPVEVARAEVALQRAAIQRAGLERELNTARAELASLWDARSPDDGPVAGALAALEAPPELAALERALAASPTLSRWPSELAARRASFEVEKARAVPDVTVSVAARYYADDHAAAAVAAFSLPLPLFDRNRGAIQESLFERKRAASDQAAALASAHAELRARYESLAQAYGEASTLRERAIPEAQRAFDGASSAYRAGVLRHIEVLDVQRTLFELRDQELRARETYHSAAAALEALIGVPLFEVAR